MKREPEVYEAIRRALRSQGLDPDRLTCQGEDTPRRVVVVAANLSDSRQQLCRSVRDQVLLLRVDIATISQLDEWVSAGVAKSRAEAAALFLREGLALRKPDLDRLAPALKKLEEARREVQSSARRMLEPKQPSRAGESRGTSRKASSGTRKKTV